MERKIVTKPTSNKSTVKKLPALILLGRFQLLFFVPELGKIIPYTYPTPVVRDLEVVKKDELVLLIKDFIAANQLDARSFTILLSDEIIFAKAILTPDLKARDDEVQSFVDTVPFEEPSVVKVVTDTRMIVAVANKEFFMSFKSAFETYGFKIEYVIPAFLLSKFVDLKKSQDQNSFSLAAKHYLMFRQYNLNLEESVVNPADRQLISNEVPKDKKRLFILGGVFGLMILILFAVIYFSMQPPKVDNLTPPAPVTTNIVSPTIAQPVLNAVIQFTPVAASKAAQLREYIVSTGVSDVELVQITSTAASSSSLVYSPKVPSTTRQSIQSKVQEYDSTVVFIENVSAIKDITIILLR